MKNYIVLILLFISSFSFSQQLYPGEDFYGVHQVIRVDFTFNQTNFWDSLVQNYQNDEYMMAIGMTITDNLGIDEKDSIAIKLKGNSSYGHPGTKKSFKIDINKYNKGSDYDGLKMLNFNNCFKDPSFMREKIFFDLCKTLGIPAPRVNYANVYMNGEFWGFYNVVEQVDDQFLDYAILDDDGNLFKAGDNSNGQLPADLVFYGNAASDYEGRYELKTNEDVNDWTDLVELITFIDINDGDNFTNGLGTKFNKQKLYQSIAIDNLFANLDAYINSARNYYIYHNISTGLWEWIKWDGNEAFGQYTGGPNTGNLIELNPNYISNSRPLVEKIFSNPTTYNEYLVEYCNIKNNYFTPAFLNPRIDSIKLLIEAHVAADTKKMYTTQNFYDNIEQNITVSGGPGSQAVFGLKSFIQERGAYLQNVSCVSGLHERDISQQIYPNINNGTFFISSDVENIKLIDNQGKELLFSKKINSSSEMEIHFESESGIYFLQGTYQNNPISVKMIKSDF